MAVSDPTEAPTALELADAVATRLRRHSFAAAADMFGVDVTFASECGRCPRCGRSLPVGSIGRAFQAIGGGAIGIPITDRERIAACLVDGFRGRHARTFPIADLIGAAHRIHAALVEEGWKHWAKRFGHAFSDTGDQEADAERIGQALEAVRRFGPPALTPGPELECLVTSFARYWPS